MLVVQADGLGIGLAQVVTAMITSNLARTGHPSRVSITPAAAPEGQRSGLLTDSVVLTDNLVTVLETSSHPLVGSPPMEEIDGAFRHTLGL